MLALPHIAVDYLDLSFYLNIDYFGLLIALGPQLGLCLACFIVCPPMPSLWPVRDLLY